MELILLEGMKGIKMINVRMLILVGFLIFNNLVVAKDSNQNMSEKLWERLSPDSPIRKACMRKDACKECNFLERLITRKGFTQEEFEESLKQLPVKEVNEELESGDGGLFQKMWDKKFKYFKEDFIRMYRIIELYAHIKTIEESYSLLSSLEQVKYNYDDIEAVLKLHAQKKEAKDNVRPTIVAKVVMLFSEEVDDLTADILKKEISENNNGQELSKMSKEDRSKLFELFFEDTEEIWKRYFTHSN